MIKKNKTYSIEEAVKVIKEESKEKFDPTVEVHIRLGVDPKKGDQQVRGSVSLPHGSGKKVRVAAFAEGEELKSAKESGADIAGGIELIEEINKTNKLDFDVAVAQPAMMPKLAKIAKILGPKGLMPSPKDGTVTQNVGKTVGELKAGMLSFKNDDTGNIHTIIGKKTFTDEKLVDNFNALMETIKKMKPSSSKGDYLKSIHINTSMGPSVKISL